MPEKKEFIVEQITPISDPEIIRLSEIRAQVEWEKFLEINGASMKYLEDDFKHAFQEGFFKGIQKQKIRIIRKMLAKGLSIEEVAEISELSVEDVRKLKD